MVPRRPWIASALSLLATLAVLCAAGCPPDQPRDEPGEPTSAAPEPHAPTPEVAGAVDDLEAYLDGYGRARRELGAEFARGDLRQKGKSLYLQFDRGDGPEEAVWRIRDRNGRISLEPGDDEARALEGRPPRPTAPSVDETGR